ncbi:MAG TPA: hypothetical protein VII58_11440, partial [Acidobacteriaceae bacterium]
SWGGDGGYICRFALRSSLRPAAARLRPAKRDAAVMSGGAPGLKSRPMPGPISEAKANTEILERCSRMTSEGKMRGSLDYAIR